MSSYNNITKIKYTGNRSDLVVLNEYIVFRDDKARRKYIVFKFSNNVTQQLLGMQFEVCQYNVDGNLIEKSVVVYNKFLAGAEEEFVPKAKLRVSYDCDTVSVRLIQAAFDRFIWKEGEYEDNSYKFDHFFRDENSLGDTGAKRKRSAPVRSEKPSKKSKKHAKSGKNKRTFIMRDAGKKNIAVFPAVFNVLAFLLVIGFVLASLLIYKTQTKQYVHNDYYLRTVSETEVAICGYTGDKTALIIPEKLDNCTVTRIDKGAFEKSKIASVQFKSDLTIAEGAFVGCKNLNEIKADGNVRIRILGGAFKNCAKLNRIDAVGTWDEGSFVNCPLMIVG